MGDPKITVLLDHSTLKLLIRAVDRYTEKKVFGSPLEQRSADNIKELLQIALMEYNYLYDK
tara:strand:+ start:1502 stop:1684 length:183 start_codon:yes stop_codon:yes gene_type:complete